MVALSLALVAALFSAAPLALAQEIPQCISDCTNQSLAAGGCTSQQDLNCVCTSSAFQTAAGTCIFANCPDLLGTAMQLQNQMCSGGGGNGGNNPSTTGGEAPTEQQPPASPTEGGEQPAPSDTPPVDTTDPAQGGTQPAATNVPTTRATTTSSRMVTVSTSRSTNATASSPASTDTAASTGAGFHTASIASGAAVALFGAVLSLY